MTVSEQLDEIINSRILINEFASELLINGIGEIKATSPVIAQKLYFILRNSDIRARIGIYRKANADYVIDYSGKMALYEGDREGVVMRVDPIMSNSSKSQYVYDLETESGGIRRGRW